MRLLTLTLIQNAGRDAGVLSVRSAEYGQQGMDVRFSVSRPTPETAGRPPQQSGVPPSVCRRQLDEHDLSAARPFQLVAMLREH